MKLTLFLVMSSFLITNAQLTYIETFCYDDYGYGRYSSLSDYGTNIRRAFTALATRASTTYFNNYMIGFGQDRVNALFSCRYDVSPQVCQSCVASAANNISWCVSSVESLIIYEECTLHYANRSIFSVMEDFPTLFHYSLLASEELEGRFSILLENTVTDLITDAASEYFVSSSYFATTTARYSSSETIYALAQCNPDITPFGCRTCLHSGFDYFTNNYSATPYAQIFMPSCRISYLLTSVEPSRPWRFEQTFRNPRSYSPSTGTRGSSVVGAIIASTSILALSLKLLL